jgi:hypothetical protein
LGVGQGSDDLLAVHAQQRGVFQHGMRPGHGAQAQPKHDGQPAPRLAQAPEAQAQDALKYLKQKQH